MWCHVPCYLTRNHWPILKAWLYDCMASLMNAVGIVREDVASFELATNIALQKTPANIGHSRLLASLSTSQLQGLFEVICECNLITGLMILSCALVSHDCI